MTRSRAVWLWVTLVIVLWVVTVFVVLPVVVRDAYAGQSAIGVLNGVIRGQASHPISYYLSAARRVALLGSVVGAALFALCVVLWRTRQRWGAVVDRRLRAAPTLGFADVVATGAWFGFLSGLAEVSSLLIRFAITRDPREAPSLHALWMGPLAGACIGLLAGLLFATLTRAWRGIAVAVPVAIFSSFAVFSTLAGLRLGLQKYALFSLCAGIAIALARRSMASPVGFRTLYRRSTPWFAGAFIVGVIAVNLVEYRRQHRMAQNVRAASAGAPNVLLLILDTVRAANASVLGYARRTTPTLERLAATGILFDQAISPAPWTLPSHASIFTGLRADGLSTDFDAPLDAAVPTLAETMAASGYATGGFVGNLVFATRASGLDRGFLTYRDHPVSLGLWLSSSFWTRQLATALLPKFGEYGGLVRKSAAEVNREFLDWVPTDGRPFFAFLNYFDAHLPYKLEPPFDRQFAARPPRYWLVDHGNRKQSPASLQEARDSYDNAIAYVDAQVAAVLDSLDRRGVLKNTIVIVTADHGEHLGEHGGILSHANSLYLQLLHVPLIISYPGQVPAAMRLASPVALQDIGATVLDLTGAAGRLPGHSLARWWQPGGAAESAGGDSLASIHSSLQTNTFSHRLDPVQKGPMRSVVYGSWHYIRNGDAREELYDLVHDGDELHNLVGERVNAAVLQDLRRRAAAGTEPQ